MVLAYLGKDSAFVTLPYSTVDHGPGQSRSFRLPGPPEDLMGKLNSIQGDAVNILFLYL